MRSRLERTETRFKSGMAKAIVGVVDISAVIPTPPQQPVSDSSPPAYREIGSVIRGRKTESAPLDLAVGGRG